MKKLFVSKSFMKKIALVLVIIILFQVVVAKPVRAEMGGTLLSPIVNLVMFLADGVISIMQNTLIEKGEVFTNLSLEGNAGFWGTLAMILVPLLILGPASIALIIWTPFKMTGVVMAVAVTSVFATGIYLAFFPSQADAVFDTVFGNSLVISNILLTPEAILKNQIPLFDVNFFAEATTGSETVSTTLRSIISGAYTMIRDLCIAVMLIIVVYIAIRMLISLSPKEKSKYKEAFTNCLVGLALIVFMHYIMSISTYLVTQITNGIVFGEFAYETDNPDSFNVQENVDADPTLVYKYIRGETIPIKGDGITSAVLKNPAYPNPEAPEYLEIKDELKAVLKDKITVEKDDKGERIVGIQAANFLEIARYKAQQVYSTDEEGENKNDNWMHIGWAFAYIMLVVLTIAFVWLYGKRFIYMAALTIFAPIVGVMYPINKSDGSRAQTLNLWLKEYIGNLIIQPFHMLLYTILIGSAMAIAVSNPIYVIIALMGITFIEKLLKDLVGIQDTKIGGLGNALRDTNRAIKTATNTTKSVASSAGRMAERGIRAGISAAENGAEKIRNKKDAGDLEDDKKIINKKAPNDLTGTEQAKKDALSNPLEEETEKREDVLGKDRAKENKLEDEDPYNTDKSFERTDEQFFDMDQDYTEPGERQESPYDDEFWREQLKESGYTDEELDEIFGGSHNSAASNAEQPQIEPDEAEIAATLRGNPELTEADITGRKSEQIKPPEFLDNDTINNVVKEQEHKKPIVFEPAKRGTGENVMKKAVGYTGTTVVGDQNNQQPRVIGSIGEGGKVTRYSDHQGGATSNIAGDSKKYSGRATYSQPSATRTSQKNLEIKSNVSQPSEQIQSQTKIVQQPQAKQTLTGEKTPAQQRKITTSTSGRTKETQTSTTMSQPVQEITKTDVPKVDSPVIEQAEVPKSGAKREKIIAGVERAATVAGSVAGTTGKVAGNAFEGVLDLAVDAMTNPGAIIDDVARTVTGSTQTISSAGGTAVTRKGQGQLSDDAKYLIREGHSEQRAQFVDALCKSARSKHQIVIDSKEDKRNIARVLKDIADKNDKTINSLIIKAIEYKRNGKTEEDYKKYIESKGVSSSVKNVLFRLYNDTRK